MLKKSICILLLACPAFAASHEVLAPEVAEDAVRRFVPEFANLEVGNVIGVHNPGGAFATAYFTTTYRRQSVLGTASFIYLDGGGWLFTEVRAGYDMSFDIWRVNMFVHED